MDASARALVCSDRAGASLPAVIPDEGIEIVRVADAPLPGVKDFAVARIILAESFEPVSDVLWDELVAMITEAGWTVPHLERVRRRLLATKTYVIAGDRKPRWQIGDWFREPSPRFYGHAWYVEQTTAPTGSPSNTGLIGAYRVEGYAKPVFAWRHDADGILAPWEASEPVAALPPHRPERSEETARSVAQTLDALRLAGRIEELERDCSDLRRQIITRDARIEYLEDVLQEYEYPADEPEPEQEHQSGDSDE